MFKTITQSRRGKRSACNQDACLALTYEGIFAVADGVGGGPAGDKASKLALNAIDKHLSSRAITTKGILAAINHANAEVLELANNTDLQGMATTLCLAWVEENRLNCFNIGDSRTYRWRQQRLIQLSNDHVATVEKEGRSKSYITKAIGIDEDPGTEITQTDWQKGDVLLIMSDGVSDKLLHHELEEIFNQPRYSMVDKAKNMIEHADLNGSTDDKTIVIAF